MSYQLNEEKCYLAYTVAVAQAPSGAEVKAEVFLMPGQQIYEQRIDYRPAYKKNQQPVRLS
jgi:hypothetical protein